MTSPYQYLTEKPIDTAERASKIWLPLGKQPAPKAELTQAEKDARLANSRAARANAKLAKASKLKTLLDYYATTTVPFERIETHTGLTDVEVAKEMSARGRSA